MDRLAQFRRILNEMVDQDRSFPSDQDSHDAVHTISIEIHQRSAGIPVAVGCAMFRLGFQLGQAAGAEAIATAREQLETWDGEAAPCTCTGRSRWWMGGHRPPRGTEPACPKWTPPHPRW